MMTHERDLLLWTKRSPSIFHAPSALLMVQVAPVGWLPMVTPYRLFCANLLEKVKVLAFVAMGSVSDPFTSVSPTAWV